MPLYMNCLLPPSYDRRLLAALLLVVEPRLHYSFSSLYIPSNPTCSPSLGPWFSTIPVIALSLYTLFHTCLSRENFLSLPTTFSIHLQVHGSLSRFNSLKMEVWYTLPYGSTLPNANPAPDIRLYTGDGLIHAVHIEMLQPGPRFFRVAQRDVYSIYHLDVRAMNSEMIRWVLICLYEVRIPPGLHERLANPETFFDTCHRILGMGLECGIAAVQHVIMGPLVIEMQEQADTFNEYWETFNGEDFDDQGSFLENDFAVHFPLLVQAMYSSPLYTLSRSVLLIFLVRTNRHALQLTPFRNIAQSYPRIQYDLYMIISGMDAY
ncbi:hypothetical protein F5B19DRAFT_324000 [Rostrohypoxylon terebratum]|nr:hypothetical protein F5B19DRAFT_324000 [Rostrohypoxylon terebratum]